MNDVVNEYNNLYHRQIKMKANDVKTRTCTEFEAENDDQNPKIRIGDGVRISKYTNLLAKRLLFKLVKRSLCDENS